MNNRFFGQWRGNFLTGLAVLLPTVLTLALIKWIFGTIATFIDLLLFFLPKPVTHDDGGKGPMFWYWSLAALVLAVRRQTRDLRPEIHGELFVCVDEAILHARGFRTSWQSEVIRYVVHGVLHLLGHDDHRAADRRKMRQEENRLLRLLRTKSEFRLLQD